MKDNLTKKTSPKKKDERTRNWMFIVYPDSAPSDWEEVIDEAVGHTSWAHSPLHNNDVNDTGELKKPHYHVLICFENKKSYEQASDISKNVNGSLVKRCESPTGTVRYFTHIDNPEKARYDRNDIKVFGGFDAITPYEASTEFINNASRALRHIVKKYRFQSYLDLCDYLEEADLQYMIRYADSHIHQTKLMLDDMYQKNKRQKYNPDTGEIKLTDKEFKEENENNWRAN